MLTVCTGWSPAGWLEYGQRFWQTFDRHWPANVRLLVYGEEQRALKSLRGRTVSMLPLSSIEGCSDFLRRWKDRPVAHGREVLPTWKASCRMAGYNFRFDAWKFSRQGFIPLAAAEACNTEFLAWLDGDVVTLRDVPPGLVEVMAPGKAVAYLGRAPKHSEIGFQLYRLPQAVRMLRRFRDLYANDEIFRYPEWHSAYAFDLARKETNTPGQDLTPGGSGNVWEQSFLRGWTVHLKGKRKAQGLVPA